MKKSFVFQAAVVVASLAMVNVACSRGKSNNDQRVGAVGPADSKPTNDQVLEATLKDMEPTYRANGKNSIASQISAASVDRTRSNTNENGAIGSTLVNLEVTLLTSGSEFPLVFKTSDLSTETKLQEGQVITLSSAQSYDSSKIGESMEVRAKCVDKCERIALIVRSFKPSQYRMGDLPQTAGMIFVKSKDQGYVPEISENPALKKFEKAQPEAQAGA